jgi:hypothetical protein
VSPRPGATQEGADRAELLAEVGRLRQVLGRVREEGADCYCHRGYSSPCGGRCEQIVEDALEGGKDA